MSEIILTYPTDDGTEEILLKGDSVSFGRGSEAEYRFEDDGLSRLHATIYREGEDIWIVDENSSNGTFVNGEKVSSSGTPLKDGDAVKIGHYTNIRVKMREKEDVATAEDSSSSNEKQTNTNASSNDSNEKTSWLIPLAITAFALLIIGASVVFIGVKVLGSDGEKEVAQRTSSDGEFDTNEDSPSKNDGEDTNENSNESTTSSIDGSTTSTPSNNNSTSGNPNDSSITDSPTANQSGSSVNYPKGKKFQEMNETEKDAYIKAKAEKISQIIGNTSNEAIPPEAIKEIKHWTQGYANRIRNTRKNDCGGKTYISSDTISLMERAKENAPFIIQEFNKQDVSPSVGLYLAWIESEHCPCLQSHTGPLGMYQFTKATGERFGLATRSGASPSNPDERCIKEPAARAAAKYMKSLTARIGTGALSIPLAIASYNSGEGDSGGLGENLKNALTINSSQSRSFWSLIANKQQLIAKVPQFKENSNYVPKFFGVAIIGENPKDFGIDMYSLSTYSK